MSEDKVTLRQRIVNLMPVILLAGIVLLFLVSLQFANREVLPSALIDKPFPEFELAELLETTTVTKASLPNEPFLLNAWGSWCGPCLLEHPTVVQAANSEFKVVGLNLRDEREKALNWLETHGNPYHLTIEDQESELAVDLGVAGVPTTFVVDQNMVIRHKHVGMLTPRVLNLNVLPLLRSFEAKPATSPSV